MIFEVQHDLISRKKALGWTNRELANILGKPPSVVSSKLNGFCVLSYDERRTLENAFSEAEKLKQEEK